MKIRSSDGSAVLLKVVKNPITRHLPVGCRKIGTSVQGKLIDPHDLVPTLPQVWAAVCQRGERLSVSQSKRPAAHSILGVWKLGFGHTHVETAVFCEPHPKSAPDGAPQLTGDDACYVLVLPGRAGVLLLRLPLARPVVAVVAAANARLSERSAATDSGKVRSVSPAMDV